MDSRSRSLLSMIYWGFTAALQSEREAITPVEASMLSSMLLLHRLVTGDTKQIIDLGAMGIFPMCMPTENQTVLGRGRCRNP